jgi:hypothetical protein
MIPRPGIYVRLERLTYLGGGGKSSDGLAAVRTSLIRRKLRNAS